MLKRIRPPLLDQQAFARERDWIVVEAGGVDSGRLDQAIASNKSASRTTGKDRRWPTPRGQRLVSGELEVEREAVWVNPPTVEHVS